MPENNQKTKRSVLSSTFRIIAFFVSFFILGALAYSSFIFYKIYSTSEKISLEKKGSQKSFFSTTKSILVDKSGEEDFFPKNRINILLLGIAGAKKPGQNLTDTIMIASLETKTKKVALFSLPRDMYVKIPDSTYYTKINSIYQYGLNSEKSNKNEALEKLKKSIKEITSLEIDYHVVLNFDGFEKIIDSLGGINIQNPRDIIDNQYPGPNYSYETFKFEKGFHENVDGKTILKYVRVRHGDPEGDFGRAKRQQQVLQAVKNKIFSAKIFLNPLSLNELFNTLGENVSTSFSIEEIGKLLKLADKLDTQNINNVVVDAWNKESLLKVSHVATESGMMFILIPRVGNYSEIQELAQNVFDLNKIKRRKDEIQKENALITVVNKSGDFSLLEKIKRLLNENLNYKNIKTLRSASKEFSEATIVFDSTDGQKPFTLDELATKIPAQVSYDKTSIEAKIKTTEEKPDLVLILGKDLVERYNMEEDTIEDLNKYRDREDELNIFKKQ